MMTGLKSGQAVAYRGAIWVVWSQATRGRQWWIGQETGTGLGGFIEASQHGFYPPTEAGLKLSVEWAEKHDAKGVHA